MKASGWSKRSAVLVAALTVVLGGSWSSSDAGTAEDDLRWMKAEPVACANVERGVYGPCDKQVVLLVNSAGEWDRAMTRLLRAGAIWCLPVPEAPEGVDWSRNGVALVALGRKLHEGYSVEIKEARLSGEELLLDVEVKVPSAESGEDKELYFPYHVVEVEKRGATRVKARFSYEVMPDPANHATATMSGSDPATS